MIEQNDAITFLKSLGKNSVDLIVTDPPYDIKNTRAGNSFLQDGLNKSQSDLTDLNIDKCAGLDWCQEIPRIQGGKINCYIWCNKAQISMYLNYFVGQLKCSFDIIVWYKPNTPPTYHNKWMSDKEYCLYFRKSGYCMPKTHSDACTLFKHPMNVKDKKIYGHPTVKPLEIIRRLIRNSSRKKQTVIDPFVGSGTTAVAALMEGRKFKCCDLDRHFVAVAQARVIDTIVNKGLE
jgi:site-specific DNA-methyltransferase (adenine-specific)